MFAYGPGLNRAPWASGPLPVHPANLMPSSRAPGCSLHKTFSGSSVFGNQEFVLSRFLWVPCASQPGLVLSASVPSLTSPLPYQAHSRGSWCNLYKIFLWLVGSTHQPSSCLSSSWCEHLLQGVTGVDIQMFKSCWRGGRKKLIRGMQRAEVKKTFQAFGISWLLWLWSLWNPYWFRNWKFLMSYYLFVLYNIYHIMWVIRSWQARAKMWVANFYTS